MPVWAIVLIDILLTGACLCVYALFHHVLTWGTAKQVMGRSNIPTAVVATQPPAAPTETPAALVIEPGPEATAEPTPTPEPVDYGQFGEKFADKFTAEGEVISTDTLYNSHDVRVELKSDRVNNSDVHILDIYVRNIENFRTTFAGGEDVYDHTRLSVGDMAARVNAVCAINGDFAGFSNAGDVVVRNGLYFESDPEFSVCVLYYDGTMETYWKRFNQPGDDYDIQAALDRGAWHAWCFGPALLDSEGHALPLNYDTNVYNPRTFLGYYEPGHYAFITVDGRSGNNTGMNLDQLAALAESLGMQRAYNLDGGGSSHMIFGGETISCVSPYEPNRTVTDILYITDNPVPDVAVKEG